MSSVRVVVRTSSVLNQRRLEVRKMSDICVRIVFGLAMFEQTICTSFISILLFRRHSSSCGSTCQSIGIAHYFLSSLAEAFSTLSWVCTLLRFISASHPLSNALHCNTIVRGCDRYLLIYFLHESNNKSN